MPKAVKQGVSEETQLLLLNGPSTGKLAAQLDKADCVYKACERGKTDD
jgi:hypothetical protein